MSHHAARRDAQLVAVADDVNGRDGAQVGAKAMHLPLRNERVGHPRQRQQGHTVTGRRAEAPEPLLPLESLPIEVCLWRLKEAEAISIACAGGFDRAPPATLGEVRRARSPNRALHDEFY